MSYTSRLKAHRAAIGRDVAIAIVGAGHMGHGFGCQISRMPGLNASVIVDLDTDRIQSLFRDMKVTDPVITDDFNTAVAALQAGKSVGITTTDFLVDLPIDVIVEATGVPDAGARISYEGLRAGIDVAVLNVEMDATIGPLLHKTAVDNGVVYTVCHGDEPIEAKALFDYAQDLQFEVIAAGKGKNNPFEPLSTPSTVADVAKAKKMNPKMLCSFTDGSKTMTEMAVLANATGLELSKRGMYGPAASIKTLAQVYSLQGDGGILDRPGVVDYCTGDVAPGVFVIVRTDDPYVNEELEYLKLGTGPYFSLYRPYHLASVEAPLSIARAVLDRESSFFAPSLKAEVVSVAKRNMNPGESIDGIGGYTVRGVADIAADTKRDDLVPIGLIQHATVVRPIKVGDFLTYDQIELDPKSFIAQLRHEQDALAL